MASSAPPVDEDTRDAVTSFNTYEEYIDSQVGDADRAYVESVETQRALVELGYRGSGVTLKREEFEARKLADRERHLHKEVAPKALSSVDKDLAGKPLLQALAAREELVRNGKLTTIIFIRDKNSKGQEVSGYIDYAHRLKTDSWEAIFEGRVKLAPRPSDLSYFNWDTGVTTSNPSPIFNVVTDGGVSGLLFKAKRDRKVSPYALSGVTWKRSLTPSFHPPLSLSRSSTQSITVDPDSVPGDSTSRTEISTTEHLQVVLWDRFVRKTK